VRRSKTADVRFAPEADKIARRLGMSALCCQMQTHAPQQKASSFNHLVGAAEQRQRDSEAEGLRSLEVYNQLQPFEIMLMVRIMCRQAS
jgi:hypothetical protein